MQYVDFLSSTNTGCLATRKKLFDGVSVIEDSTVPFRDIGDGKIVAIEFTAAEIEQIKYTGKVFVITHNGIPEIELNESALLLYRR